MNIAPPNVTPQLKPNIDTSPYPRRQQEGESFDEVLAAALRSPSGSQIGAGRETIPVDNCFSTVIDYRPALEDGTSAIGEDAVRFDARPIVGPLFVPSAPPEEALSGPADTPQVGLLAAEASFVEPELHLAIALAARRIGAMASPPSGSGVTANARSRPDGRAVIGAAARAGEPLASSRPIRWVAQESSAAPRQALESRRSEVRTDISLTVLADEILVTVRGLDLTADEEEALANEARGLLASLDLGGRSLRVLTFRSV